MFKIVLILASLAFCANDSMFIGELIPTSIDKNGQTDSIDLLIFNKDSLEYQYISISREGKYRKITYWSNVIQYEFKNVIIDGYRIKNKLFIGSIREYIDER